MRKPSFDAGVLEEVAETSGRKWKPLVRGEEEHRPVRRHGNDRLEHLRSDRDAAVLSGLTSFDLDATVLDVLPPEEADIPAALP